MNDAEIRRVIKEEVRKSLAPIAMGFIVSNENVSRSTVKRMALEGPIPNTRSIQPFGISSRAPNGTEGLIIPVNGDATHLNLAGHFDVNKPSNEDGETILYDAYGHIVYLSQTKMQFGSKASANPMMLGDIVQELFSNILRLIAEHRHLDIIGYLTEVPTNAEDFLALKASPVDDGAIISDKAFTEK